MLLNCRVQLREASAQFGGSSQQNGSSTYGRGSTYGASSARTRYAHIVIVPIVYHLFYKVVHASVVV
jgi:hypothetical protein